MTSHSAQPPRGAIAAAATLMTALTMGVVVVLPAVAEMRGPAVALLREAGCNVSEAVAATRPYGGAPVAHGTIPSVTGDAAPYATRKVHG